MSRIPDLGKNFEKLPNIVREYQDALDGVADILSIKGKTLKEANREAQHQFFYEEKKTEMETLVKYLETRIFAVRSQLFRHYTEKFPRELSDRAKDKYIDSESTYLEIKEIYLEIWELFGKYEDVCESFRSRGYALNNITRATIAQVEDNVI